MAAILRQRGMHTGAGDSFTSRSVKWARRSAGLKSLRERLRAKGMLTTDEMAEQLGVSVTTVRLRSKLGLIAGRRTDDMGAWLFEPPGVNPTTTSTDDKAERQPRPNSIATASTAGGAV